MKNSQPNIKIYTTKNCPFSKKMKDFLYDNELVFEEVDIGTDKDKIEECFNVSGVISTPVLVVTNSLMRTLALSGWNEDNRNLIGTLLNV